MREMKRDYPNLETYQLSKKVRERWYSLPGSDQMQLRKGERTMSNTRMRVSIKKGALEYRKQKIQKERLKKLAQQFRNLFSPKYVRWIPMQARLLAMNNYGVWSSVEEASAHLDKAVKELAQTLAKGIEGEINRLVDEEREDIIEEMTDNVVSGPNLPQMGPDQMYREPAPKPMTEALPEAGPPQQVMAPPAKKLAQVFDSVDNTLDTYQRNFDEVYLNDDVEVEEVVKPEEPEEAPMSPALKAAFGDKIALELHPLGPNMNEVETEDVLVLFSYSTPVAYQDKNTGEFYRTEEHYSVTTSRHINKWLEGREAVEVPQDQLTSLLRTAGIEDFLNKKKKDGPDKKKDEDKKEDKKDDKGKDKKKKFPFKKKVEEVEEQEP